MDATLGPVPPALSTPSTAKPKDISAGPSYWPGLVLPVQWCMYYRSSPCGPAGAEAYPGSWREAAAPSSTPLLRIAACIPIWYPSTPCSPARHRFTAQRPPPTSGLAPLDRPLHLVASPPFPALHSPAVPVYRECRARLSPNPSWPGISVVHAASAGATLSSRTLPPSLTLSQSTRFPA